MSQYIYESIVMTTGRCHVKVRVMPEYGKSIIGCVQIESMDDEDVYLSLRPYEVENLIALLTAASKRVAEAERRQDEENKVTSTYGGERTDEVPF